MRESELMAELTSIVNSIKNTIDSSSEVQKTGVTPTRQTPDLTQDIIKGHFQRLELGTSEGPDSRTRQ